MCYRMIMMQVRKHVSKAVKNPLTRMQSAAAILRAAASSGASVPKGLSKLRRAAALARGGSSRSVASAVDGDDTEGKPSPRSATATPPEGRGELGVGVGRGKGLLSKMLAAARQPQSPGDSDESDADEDDDDDGAGSTAEPLDIGDAKTVEDEGDDEESGEESDEGPHSLRVMLPNNHVAESMPDLKPGMSVLQRLAAVMTEAAATPLARPTKMWGAGQNSPTPLKNRQAMANVMELSRNMGRLKRIVRTMLTRRRNRSSKKLQLLEPTAEEAGESEQADNDGAKPDNDDVEAITSHGGTVVGDNSGASGATAVDAQHAAETKPSPGDD